MTCVPQPTAPHPPSSHRECGGSDRLHEASPTLHPQQNLGARPQPLSLSPSHCPSSPAAVPRSQQLSLIPSRCPSFPAAVPHPLPLSLIPSRCPSSPAAVPCPCVRNPKAQQPQQLLPCSPRIQQAGITTNTFCSSHTQQQSHWEAVVYTRNVPSAIYMCFPKLKGI